MTDKNVPADAMKPENAQTGAVGRVIQQSIEGLRDNVRKIIIDIPFMMPPPRRPRADPNRMVEASFDDISVPTGIPGAGGKREVG